MAKKKANGKRITPVQPVSLTLTYADLPKLLDMPWEWGDDSVSDISITDCFHYIPAKDRQEFMEELYRILIDNGKATIITAYYSTALAYADFHLEWPPVCEQSFLYFNKGWRDANQLPYNMECDFDFGYGYMLKPEVATKSAETQTFHINNYLNTVQRLQVTLTKRPKEAK